MKRFHPCFAGESKIMSARRTLATQLSNPGAPSTIALLAQLQAMLTARKRSFSNKHIFTFASLYKTDPRKFFQQTRALQSSLPSEQTTPSAWDPLISKLTSPPQHRPPPTCHPHTSHSHPPQTHSIHPSQLKKSASAYSGFTMAEQVLCKAIHLTSSDMPNPFPHQSPQLPPTSSFPAYRPCSMKLTAQARYLSNGRLLSSPPSSNMGTLQTLPTTDRLQLGNPCAGYTQIFSTTG